MAHEDCKKDWDSVLTPTGGSPDSDGVIEIREVRGKLKGKHATSTSDFDITCNGNKTKISFTRDDNTNKKRISYKGDFKSDDVIKGKFTRTELVSLGERNSSKKGLTGDSGDWDATKVPTLLTKKARAAKGSAKTTKKRSAAAKKSAKKSAKKQARKTKS